MEHRALRLPRAEPLLHVPISAIVEFVSNRSEAEVLLRIGDLAHEFDHLTVSLVQWLEHQQYLSIDSQECLPALGAGQSLTSSLAPLTHQARAANRHGVRVLQQKISETLAQLQRHMDAVEVFSNQNASFSQELQLCGLRDRADQRRRLAETESTLASRLSRFLGGCDSLYDEHPSPLAMNLAAGTTSGGRATGGGSGGGGAAAPAAAAAAAASIAKPAVEPSPSTPAVTPTAVAPAVAPAAVAPVAPATYDTGTAPQRREHTCAKEAQRAYLTRDNTDDPKHPPGSGGKYACTGGSTGRKRPRPPLPAAENVGTGSTHHGDSIEEAATHGDDRYRKQPRQRQRQRQRRQQQQQQQQQPTQDEEDDVHDDDGSFPAPSFLTPPLIAAAPAVSGSGNRAAPGLVAAPHSACSSLGSTPSTGSSSPALAVASPAPTPKSSPRRLADGESMGNRPGGGGGGGAAAAAASEATPWNAYGGHGRRRARADSDGGGGGAVGLGEVTVLAAAASATGGGAAVAGPLSEEQPHSSLGFGSSPTPPSTREPSPPPLSTQEGSVSAAEGIGDNDRMGEREGEEEEQEEDSTTARDSGECGVYGSFWPAQGGGGRGTGKTGPGGDDAAAAVAAAADRALAVAGADASGAGGGGVSGFLLRAPPPTCRNGVEVAESLQEGGRDSGAEERENEVGEEEEEEEEGGDEVDDEDMLDTAETVEDSMLPALLAAPTAIADATAPDEEEEAAAEVAVDAPPCWGSQDGADEAGGADAEAGLTGGVGTRAGRSGGLGSGRT